MKTTFSLLSLALIKFHYRPVRTVITILFSSVLFSVLVILAITLSGFNRSIDTYKDNGLNGRFIVTAMPNSNQITKGLFSDDSLIETAEKLQSEDQAEKASFAKEIGAEYDPNSEIPTVSHNTFPTGPESRLNLRSPIAGQALDLYYADNPRPNMADLKNIAKPYHPSDFFTSTAIEANHRASLSLIPDSSKTNETDRQSFNNYLTSLPVEPDQLIKPFVFKDTKWQPQNNTIPVVLSIELASTVLGIDNDHQATETPKERLQAISEIYDKSKGKVFSVCYRNTIAIDQGIDDSCQAKESETLQIEEISEAQKRFDEKYGIEYEPIYQDLKFEIVGLSPDATDVTKDVKDLDSAIQMIIKSATLPSLTIPLQMYNQLEGSDLAKLFEPYVSPLYSDGTKPNEISYVEFTNRTDLNNFIADKSCHSSASGLCLPETNVFNLSAFDPTTEAFDDLRTKAASLSQYIALAISALAIVILTILISYVSTSSRRESAVYRALGFRRRQLATIFIFYSLVIAFLVLVISFAAGWGLALLIDSNVGPALDVQAQLAFGVSDSGAHFNLIGSNYVGLLQVATLVILSGLIASIFPIISSVKRSPAKDLRVD